MFSPFEMLRAGGGKKVLLSNKSCVNQWQCHKNLELVSVGWAQFDIRFRRGGVGVGVGEACSMRSATDSVLRYREI